jgi:hypothetical protein
MTYEEIDFLQGAVVFLGVVVVILAICLYAAVKYPHALDK